MGGSLADSPASGPGAGWLAAGSVFDGYRRPLGFVRMGKGAACHSGSSGIGSDKAGLLYNKAHGEAEKTEGKNITEVPTAQESDREVKCTGLFLILEINTIHNSHRQMP